jgi:hypothetical protein
VWIKEETHRRALERAASKKASSLADIMSTNNVCHNVALAQADQMSPLLLVSKFDLSEVDDEKLVMVFDKQ